MKPRDSENYRLDDNVQPRGLIEHRLTRTRHVVVLDMHRKLVLYDVERRVLIPETFHMSVGDFRYLMRQYKLVDRPFQGSVFWADEWLISENECKPMSTFSLELPIVYDGNTYVTTDWYILGREHLSGMFYLKNIDGEDYIRRNLSMSMLIDFLNDKVKVTNIVDPFGAVL